MIVEVIILFLMEQFCQRTYLQKLFHPQRYTSHLRFSEPHHHHLLPCLKFPTKSHSNPVITCESVNQSMTMGCSGFRQKRSDILQRVLCFQTQTKCSRELKTHNKNVERDLSCNICLTISNYFVISLSVELYGLQNTHSRSFQMSFPSYFGT